MPFDTSGLTTVATTTDITTYDQNWFTQFRIGLAPDYYPGVQFAPTKNPWTSSSGR
jgi:hypothetical protein